jgi:perosamine synthetase
MTFISHSKPSMTSQDISVVSRILRSGQLAPGQKVLDFESKISSYLGVKSGIATNSGTSALHLALIALNIRPNDEVIIPSYVCSALLNAIAYVGAKPKIVDVKEDDFNLSALEVKKKLSKKVRAIIVPHMFGCPADLKELLGFGIPVIEDCAQSIGATYMGRKAGSFGVLSICSFYATKVITTGEGGMVLSNNEKLLDRIRDLRAYDHAKNLKTRYNYKMTEFQAALGLSQLQRLPQFIHQRKQIAQAYDRAFTGIGIIPTQDNHRESIYYRYVVKTKKAHLLINHLKRQGIEATLPVFKPLHSYVKGFQCPATQRLMNQCVSIPIYPNLSNRQVHWICQTASKFGSHRI